MLYTIYSKTEYMIYECGFFKTVSKGSFLEISVYWIYIVFRYLKTMQTIYFFERGDSQLFPGTKILKIRLLEKEKSKFENEAM